MILAGDVGGTKSHLALFNPEGPAGEIRGVKYKSSHYSNLSEIVLQFLKDHPGVKVDRACFGIAGPIQGGICRATNLPWVVDAALIGKEAGIPCVTLINDLEANAYGIGCLKEDEFFLLNPGKSVKGNSALIAAGTGLGEAGIYWDNEKLHPFASEGGHCSFAPESDLEIRLLCYLRKKFDHVSYERILSGPGLYTLYRFIIEEGIETECEEVKAAIEIRDPPEVIAQAGMKRRCPACARSLELFVSIYAGESANLALKMLAVGGLFMGGGDCPQDPRLPKRGQFY